MKDINIVKVLSVNELKSWKDSGGSYSEIQSLVKINNEIKKVTFFVCSDSPDRLVVWNGWNVDYTNDLIMFDEEFKNINDKDIFNIYSKLKNELSF